MSLLGSHHLCQFILGHVTYVSLYWVMWHMSVYTESCDMSVYTESCDICQFILSHVTCVNLYSVIRLMSVCTRSCDMLIYTRSCDICQFHIPLLYVIHPEAVDVSQPLFILMCIIIKWVLPRVTFGVMNIWSATAFSFCSCCRTLDPKNRKRKASKTQRKTIEAL